MEQGKLIVLVIGIVILGGAGYGAYSYFQSDDNKQSNSNSETQNSSEDTSNQNQQASGDQTVEGRLVDGFPGSKVPLYRGDVVESSRSTDSQGRAEYNVRIQTSDDMQKVVDRTETNYMNDGWDITTRPTGSMFIAHHDEFIVTVSFSENDGGVLINYGISTK